jgi:hypothetical protein
MLPVDTEHLADTAGYMLPVDTERGQALQDTGCLWTQNTVGRHSRYRLPVATEHCGQQAQQDTGCLWTQNIVGRHNGRTNTLIKWGGRSAIEC